MLAKSERISMQKQTTEWTPAPEFPAGQAVQAKWSARDVYHLALIVGACLAVAVSLPESAWRSGSGRLFAVLGVIGVWRYSWWLTHFVRAKYYEHRVYPKLAADAGVAWMRGWRPPRVHVLLTTYREPRETAEKVVRGICAEVRAIGQPATIWIGSREAVDEANMLQQFKLSGSDLDLQIRVIRQTQPGKRVAIALLLRAMARDGLGANDFVAFMDGDFVLMPGALSRSLALFATDPELHAVTTDEDVVVHGPKWIQSWLSLRFAQRRLTMQSHAVSGRVLTLTGRFSVFRATYITTEEFIRLLEADHLNHWLWGSFRFLSGDDKSTWYALLTKGVRMLYVPDAQGYTIEHIEGAGIDRMWENLRRWSGNMLRNGARAIALGPRRMPVFIWWCLIDQRLAMWTMLLGPLLAVIAAVKFGWAFLIAYAVYVVLTRLLVSLVLFSYSPRVDFHYVWCLYANQIVNASVKLYMIWRLPNQRWSNRGNQTQNATGGRVLATTRSAMAVYLTALSISTLVLVALLAVDVLPQPSWALIGVLRATP
jgi:mannuronan synthase